MNVAVCGMPRSGNRLVQRLLQRHGFVAEVRHFGDRKVLRTGGPPEAAVMPLRNREPHWASCWRDFSILPKPPGGLTDPGTTTPELSSACLHAAHFWPALAHLAELGIPVLPVRYEAIVEDPEREGRRILAFLGCDQWKGWGEEITDGNAKWEAALSDAPGVQDALELQEAMSRPLVYFTITTHAGAVFPNNGTDAVGTLDQQAEAIRRHWDSMAQKPEDQAASLKHQPAGKVGG